MSNQLQVSGEAKIRTIQGPVVANSGVITALNGDATEYVRGDGTLADFPTSTGGGSSVSYYLNTSVSQGTIGGVAYKQLSKTPISGAGTDVTISANGYIASYITDANDPALLEVPAGNFNCEFYFSVNSNAHNPYVYAEVYKYDGTTFTLLGSNVSIPQYLNNGTTLSPYYFAIAVSTAVLTVTDRIAIRIYVNVDGRTVTLHTENNHLCQVVTTFSKGLISLNNLTRQNQFFGTGTSGTDFAISSATATHTFNLPVASAANTGKLSSTDWSTFNGKVPYTGAITDLNLGANLLRFTTEATDNASIGTSVSGSSSYFDFNLSDDNNQEEWRFRFTPSGGSVYDAVRIRPVSATKSDLLVSGDIGASNFSGASGGTNTGDVTLGTANGLSLAGQVLSLATSSASTTGALTSTDWSSFNSKVSSQWTTSGSDIFYNTGNVCVNTTTSGVGRFFVAADNDSGITIRNTGTADRFQLFVGSTGGATYTADNAIIKGTNTAIDFYNGSTATKKVTIPNSGNYLEVYGDAYVQSYVKIGNGSGNYTALTTIASGTKIVTFPNAAGTVALTSDIPSLTGYVPYTGATTNLDMGANGLYANNLTIRKISTSATIDFPNTGTMNDPAFIRHTESPDNTAVMSFSVGDNDATNDYFVFGNTSSGFVERFKITATGVVTIGTWNGTAIADAYISSAATWNAKVSSVSATSPVVSSGGTTPTISMAAATTSVSGYLTSTDWNTFNNKGTFTLPSLTSGSVLFSNGSTIAQDNANFFWDDTNNRLGIGNAAPSHPLDVTGIIKGSTSIYATNDLFIGDTTGSATGRLIITDSSNQGVNIRRNNAVSERFKLFVGNGTTYTQDNAIILGTNTDIDFYTGSSPLKRLTISNSGAATFSDNVGIGGVTLASWYTGYTAMQLGASASIYGNKTTADTNTTQLANNAYLNTGATNWQYINTDEATRYEQVNGQHNFYSVVSGSGNITWGTSKMTINSAGNVGIGTSSPASQATGATTGILDVSAATGGNLVLHRNGSSDTALFSILKSSNGTYIDSTGAATAANNAIIFRVNNTNANQTIVNEAMRIQSDRKVIVNADDNGIILRAATANQSIFYEWQNSSNTRRGYIGYGASSSSTFEISNNENGVIDFRTNGNFAMRIANSLNIGFNSVVYNNTTSATTRTLYIGGDYFIGGISSIRESKKNIEDVSNVDWLYQLNPVTFNYRKKDDEGKYTEEIYDELNYGLIAEDTQPIADFLINYDDTNDEKKMIGIEYSRLVTPMLKAIQELKAEIEILKNK